MKNVNRKELQQKRNAESCVQQKIDDDYLLIYSVKCKYESLDC